MAKTLSEQEVLRLARLGALARLRELEEEAQAIRRMFPGLKAAAEGPIEAPKAERKPKARRGGSRMSPEARRAAAERMKAYWAKKKGLPPVPAEAPQATSESAADAARKARGGKGKARGRKRRQASRS